MPWLCYPEGGNRKASDRRLVRPTLRGALLGLEIGTSQGTLPVAAGCFRRTPHIALSGAFLALRASDCNGWPRRWVHREDGAIGAPEEPAGFRRKTRASELLSPWKWRESNSPSPRPSPQRLRIAHIYLCSYIIISLYHSHLCIL